MRINYIFFFLIISVFCISSTTSAQSVNLDETWKEFLENDKISNMSALNKPSRVDDRLDYAKYLLMNTNSNFCQSKLERAENLMEEIQAMDKRVHEYIPGFKVKMEELDSKIKAYHSMDAIWKRFLRTQEVNLKELNEIKAAKTSCEKQTLAKYSYMTAYYHLCEGDMDKSRDIFQNRTLRLAEKTTLRVRDVEGLAEEVAKMKGLYQDMAKLEVAWRAYVKSGVSSGYDRELPLFPCYPIPNIKQAVLKGMADVCKEGPEMFEEIGRLQAKSGVSIDRELKEKITELETAIGLKEDNLAALNEAWEAFIPDNTVRHAGKYAYDYCTVEPLIRAYIMDGFTYVCDLAEESLQEIDALRRKTNVDLEQITLVKIRELMLLTEDYQANGERIDAIWSKFVANGDNLSEDYESTDDYCDNIHHVKDWAMKGLSGTCEEGIMYIEKIEEFQRTLDFNFYEELECRVQQLRINVWECRHKALQEVARLGSTPDTYEEKLTGLMEEYEMVERPEVCPSKR